MENLISKELLSEVLEIEIIDFDIVNKNNVRINLLRHEKNPLNDELKLSGVPFGSKGAINIYELAHKCKEWALDKGYMIKSQILLNGQGHSVIQKKENDTQTMGWCADTEYKAIFKATQYIYDNEATDER